MTRCIARTLLAVLAVASEAANGLEKVVFSGRWFQAPGGMQFSWGTGTFLVRFLGTGLSAELEPYALPMYHTCQVDQAEPQRIEHLSGLLSIASGLSAGEHLVRCGRSTEAFYGPTVLLGFRVEGAGGTLLEAPALSDKALRVAFLGDSITAGWQVLLPAGSTEQGGPANEDAFRTWAADLARSWTEDWRTVAQTSIGVLPHTSFGVPFASMRDRFLCSELQPYSSSCPKPWDFQWQADVVVINLGTNDFIFNDPSQCEFSAAYLELLETVRSKYPAALIFCIMPLVHTCKGDAKWQKMVQGITEAVARLRAADERVQLINTGSFEAKWLNCAEDYVDGLHPTVAGGQKFAARLLPLLTPRIREVFPDKCLGTSCEGTPTTPTLRGSTTSASSFTTSTSTTAFETTHAGSAVCCYPDCGDPNKVCNDAEESEFCVSSAANCRQCGGELCGTAPSTSAGPVATTAATTAAATTTTTTTTTTTAAGTVEPTSSSSQSGAGVLCCYPGCDSDVCDADAGDFCSQSSENCAGCGGQLCPSSRSSSLAPARCCYPNCQELDVCNDREDSPFCTSSPENCQSCGGELC